jgi:hypothetical protein
VDKSLLKRLEKELAELKTLSTSVLGPMAARAAPAADAGDDAEDSDAPPEPRSGGSAPPGPRYGYESGVGFGEVESRYERGRAAREHADWGAKRPVSEREPPGSAVWERGPSGAGAYERGPHSERGPERVAFTEGYSRSEVSARRLPPNYDVPYAPHFVPQVVGR